MTRWALNYMIARVKNPDHLDRYVTETIIQLHRARGERFDPDRHWFMVPNPTDLEEIAIGFVDTADLWLVQRISGVIVPVSESVLGTVRDLIGVE